MPSSANAAFLDAAQGVTAEGVLGALVSAGVPARVLDAALRAVHPRLGLAAVRAPRDGAEAVRVGLKLPPGTEAMTLDALRPRLSKARLSAPVKADALRVVARLKGAGSRIRGRKAWEVLAGAAGAAAGFHHLLGGSGRIYAGPVCVGARPAPRGHPGLPTPTPAALDCLKGFEVRFVPEAVGAVTAAGAAVLSGLARPGPAPAMCLAAMGYGAGAEGSLFRISLGRTAGEEAPWLWEIRTNLDDCSPQVFDHLGDRLFAAGALDVVLLPVQMKKGRPAVCLEVLAAESERAAVEAVILTETPTLGLRRHRVERSVLPREVRPVRTRFGALRVKRALDPRGVWKAMPEYEDCRRAAVRSGAPLREVMAAALNGLNGNGGTHAR